MYIHGLLEKKSKRPCERGYVLAQSQAALAIGGDCDRTTQLDHALDPELPLYNRLQSTFKTALFMTAIGHNLKTLARKKTQTLKTHLSASIVRNTERRIEL